MFRDPPPRSRLELSADVDDIHSVASVATILSDPRLERVKYHAVAGAYGTQTGKMYRQQSYSIWRLGTAADGTVGSPRRHV